MYSTIYKCIFISIILYSLSSCSSHSTKENAINSDSIAFNALTIKDSVFINAEHPSEGKYRFKLNAVYPSHYKDSVLTNKIIALFSKAVIDLNYNPDSTSIKHLFKSYVKNNINQFSAPSTDGEEECEPFSHEENNAILNYSCEIKISPYFNQNNILCISKEKINYRNNQISTKDNYYYNFNLLTMEQIELNNLFSEEQISQINELLKAALMRQLKVTDEDDLVEIGYFNIDNLMANNNFRIDSKGLTWTFLPLEIACFNVGDVNIFLSYATLEKFIPEDCILHQFTPKK